MPNSVWVCKGYNRLESFFENEAKPVVYLSQEARRTEISEKRNALEQLLRRKIKQVFEVRYGAKQRCEVLLSSIERERRDSFLNYKFEDVVDEDRSPLYFRDLKQIIERNWDNFENVLRCDKPEFTYHMSVVNGARADAHASGMQDDEFEKVRISFREMDKALQ